MNVWKQNTNIILIKTIFVSYKYGPISLTWQIYKISIPIVPILQISKLDLLKNSPQIKLLLNVTG